MKFTALVLLALAATAAAQDSTCLLTNNMLSEMDYTVTRASCWLFPFSVACCSVISMLQQPTAALSIPGGGGV